ncbi:MAG: hypothetical protein QF463_14110 [Vicinamibacterales bacterium]|jgi:hypothetical protein|nr:hypothetical protein [Acidobacteriota bacterium]MDP6371609.1 hypothetical protein [Vicinamibacterales bacterium]MDP6610198.1 hypothetical protein [Vicinamibacterales bacterium]HAK56329.1 hypothetical protein [Acidobacteriota bacterium]|tara:strand:+ start:5153 stop:5686 length:534 start_codon:yes stop_codon:yes gene_type:complete
MIVFTYRLMRAALLDASVYEEIERDRSAGWQALAVVLLSSLAAGLGSAGWRGPELSVQVSVTAMALVTWAAWAVLVLQIGGRWLSESATRVDMGELLRTVGFAAAPGLLQVFAALPAVTLGVYVVTWIWMFAAMVVAIRQALDYATTLHAVAVCAVALSLSLGLAFLLGVLLGPTVG